MSAPRYFIVTDRALQQQLEDYAEAQISAFKLREKIGLKLGATNRAAITQFVGPDWGIKDFKEPPDTKLWRFDEKHGCWKPRRSKPCKPILEAMYCDETKIPDGWALADIIKFKPMQHMGPLGRGGFGFPLPGLTHGYRGKTQVRIIVLQSVTALAGCKRISDIEFERLTAERKAKGVRKHK